MLPLRTIVRLAGCAAILASTFSVARAQSGSRYQPGSRSQPRAPQGFNSRGTAPPMASGSRHDSADQVAMEGYCPVCVMEMKKWVRGSAQHAARYDGKVYYFPGERQKQMFLANPAKYVPALGGDCVVCAAKMSERVAGNIRYAAFYRNRLYLFPSDKQRAMFRQNPSKFADFDLALGGNCVVCLVEMNQQVPGKPEFTVVYHGMRYQFPGAKQRDMFLASPEKYAAATAGHRQVSAIKQTSARLVHVRGTSGCAACDYGIHPIRDEDELGLAVRADDGTVYIVESAHSRYPELYEKRFDGLKLELTGKVLKRDGNFVWVDPEDVKAI